MIKYTVEWHDKMLRWNVVRWDITAEGARVGTTVDRCAILEDAQELCNYHTDMMNPELWADVGCEFDREIA